MLCGGAAGTPVFFIGMRDPATKNQARTLLIASIVWGVIILYLYYVEGGYYYF